MPRKVLLLLMCALLLLNLAACGRSGGSSGEPAATAEPEPTAPAGDFTYAEAYMQYLSVCSALRDTVESRLETHNAILKDRDPDSYYMNSDYLLLVYAPFSAAYPGLGSALGRDNLEVDLRGEEQLMLVGEVVVDRDHVGVEVLLDVLQRGDAVVHDGVQQLGAGLRLRYDHRRRCFLRLQQADDRGPNRW